MKEDQKDVKEIPGATAITGILVSQDKMSLLPKAKCFDCSWTSDGANAYTLAHAHASLEATHKVRVEKVEYTWYFQSMPTP